MHGLLSECMYCFARQKQGNVMMQVSDAGTLAALAKRRLADRSPQERLTHALVPGCGTTDGQRTKQVEYTMPLKKQPMGPTEAYCIEQYNVLSKEPGGWVVDIHVETPKV